ncbi:hypothetical protein P4B35_23570 [Pontiellaceae bacterium B12227]|nr:hypothetical protein [Pontiellaceae bacterium B12227]
MNEIPERLILQATFNGDPVEGIMLRVGFGVTAKNSHSVIFGLTNHDGCAVLTKKEIIEDTTETVKLSMMDYRPLEDVFDGNICYKALGADDIEKAISGYASYHKYTTFPEGYKDKLEKALSNPMSQKASEIKVTWLK